MTADISKTTIYIFTAKKNTHQRCITAIKMTDYCLNTEVYAKIKQTTSNLLIC